MSESEDTNPVLPFDQGVPDAVTCRYCSFPRVFRNGFRLCATHDRLDLMPAATPPFKEPGE